jgi:uncharacterized delta-60 repeat protein
MFSAPTPHAGFRFVVAASLVLASATPAAAQAVDAFNPGANSDVSAIAIQPDGKILVGGLFTGLGGGTGTTPRNYIGRLNADGTVDTTFNPGASGPSGAAGVVYAIAVQPDGKIVVGGFFTGLGGGTGTTTRNRIGRLNADGTVDATFNPGANSSVYAIAIQPDGKILVGGDFTGLGGGTGTTPRNCIGRLNADGTVDATFNPGANSSVYAIAIQPDGKILVGGGFTGLGGGTGTTTRRFIGRLSADGSLDAAFNPGANNVVYAVAIQPDGKTLVGGNFTGLGGGTGLTTRNRIGRLNPDGTVDTVFNPGANNIVNGLALQTDGRILVSGLVTLLGGGTRRFIGRLNATGSLDGTFDPGANNAVSGMALQPDGKVLAVGGFTGLGGGTGTTPRNRIGRLLNNLAATQSFILTGTSVVTWSRGGASPELQWAQFAYSVDGVNYTDLGAGTRVAGGWEVTGLSLPVDPNLTIRARGFYATGSFTGSGSIVEFIAMPSGPNMIQNGDFSATVAPTSWTVFEEPDIVYNVAGGVFQFYRQNPTTTASGQATIFQLTGQPVAANTPLRAQFDIGNSSTARKRISVLAIDSDFSDITVCTFWLAPGAPLRTYTMRTHTTKTWSNAALYFYAATKGQNGGFYQLDNVSLQVDPAVSTSRTDCVDPTAPPPPGGSPDADLIVNGNFQAGDLTSWSQFGSMTWQVVGGVFEFIRPAPLPTPAGVIYQNTGQAMTANDILTATFQLGNSSAVRKRVTVLLQESDFSDLTACTFWLAPFQPLGDYAMRAFATKAWTNATLAIYAASVGSQTWTRIDNVTFRRTPGTAIVGTECVEPASSPFAGPGILGADAPARPAAESSIATLQDGALDWRGTRGFGRAPDSADEPGSVGWLVVASGDGVEVLYWTKPVDLTDATSPRMTFQSVLPSRSGSIGELQVTIDGIRWHTVAAVRDGEVWISADLSAFRGHIVYVRFVFRTVVKGV